MSARILVVVLFAAMVSGGVFLFKAYDNASKQLARSEMVAEGLKKQVVGIAEGFTRELKANEEAYRVRDTVRANAQTRREKARVRLSTHDGEVLDWRNAAVPAAVVVSLCDQPGSCTRLPETAGTTSGAAEAGAGNTPSLRLTNESLREGIEGLRRDLAGCNANIAGLCAWCRQQNPEECTCEY